MRYEEIMQKITSGLTGQPEADMKYLFARIKRRITNETLNG